MMRLRTVLHRRTSTLMPIIAPTAPASLLPHRYHPYRSHRVNGRVA